MTKTRCLVMIGLALALVSIGAAAQTVGKVYRVGFLTVAGSGGGGPLLDGLIQGLAQRGYSVGANLSIESRFADGKPERLPGLVKELLDSGVDVIATRGYPATRAAKDGTATVPIVAAGAGDPVETGLAASFNRRPPHVRLRWIGNGRRPNGGNGRDSRRMAAAGTAWSPPEAGVDGGPGGPSRS